MKRWPLVASFLLFILLCVSIAYWGMQLFKPPQRPVAAPPRAVADIRPEDAAVLFGGRAGKVAVASNYQLKGVVMAGSPRDSVAILSADGKPARAVAVGKEVMPGVTVKAVYRNYVLLSEGGVIKRVELPQSAKVQVDLAATAPVGTQATAPDSAGQQQSVSSSAVPPPSASPAAPPMPLGAGAASHPSNNNQTAPVNRAAPGVTMTAPPTMVVRRPQHTDQLQQR